MTDPDHLNQPINSNRLPFPPARLPSSTDSLPAFMSMFPPGSNADDSAITFNPSSWSAAANTAYHLGLNPQRSLSESFPNPARVRQVQALLGLDMQTNGGAVGNDFVAAATTVPRQPSPRIDPLPSQTTTLHHIGGGGGSSDLLVGRNNASTNIPPLSWTPPTSGNTLPLTKTPSWGESAYRVMKNPPWGEIDTGNQHYDPSGQSISNFSSFPSLDSSPGFLTNRRSPPSSSVRVASPLNAAPPSASNNNHHSTGPSQNAGFSHLGTSSVNHVPQQQQQRQSGYPQPSTAQPPPISAPQLLYIPKIVTSASAMESASPLMAHSMTSMIPTAVSYGVASSQASASNHHPYVNTVVAHNNNNKTGSVPQFLLVPSEQMQSGYQHGLHSSNNNNMVPVPSCPQQQMPKKRRKTISDKDRGFHVGHWSEAECQRFEQAVEELGTGKWIQVAERVKTRSTEQCRSHAQKWLLAKKQKLEGHPARTNAIKPKDSVVYDYDDKTNNNEHSSSGSDVKE